jgi:hypothetical protein
LGYIISQIRIATGILILKTSAWLNTRTLSPAILPMITPAAMH